MIPLEDPCWVANHFCPCRTQLEQNFCLHFVHFTTITHSFFEFECVNVRVIFLQHNISRNDYKNQGLLWVDSPVWLHLPFCSVLLGFLSANSFHAMWFTDFQVSPDCCIHLHSIHDYARGSCECFCWIISHSTTTNFSPLDFGNDSNLRGIVWTSGMAGRYNEFC